MTQKPNNLSSNLFQINLAVIFISTSGVLGRYIDLPTPIIIGLRALIGGLALFAFCKWRGFDFKISSKDRWTVMIGGVLLGAHWVTYFYALKLSNVAIGMLSLFTFPAITAILEPIILKTKLLKSHLFLGATVLVGIYFLVPEFDMENDNLKAVGFGVASAFCYSIRNIILKPKVDQYNGSVLMMNQLFVITILLCPLIFILDSRNIVEFLPATLLLAILTTSIGHTMLVYSLKHFSTASASIISSLQPVYGIILGIIFLSEYPKSTTIIGGLIIVSSVAIESYRVNKVKPE